VFNPVLVTIEVLGLHPLLVPTAALVFAFHTIANDMATVFFYSMRVFLHSILSIFFRSIEVVGTENIPVKGPVIFTGNHSNQFVDGLQVTCTGVAHAPLHGEVFCPR
jgi:glycerol-3-phosphate O-acyltransferase / dihydroxyacetone phosphate acyltransferase